MDYSKMRDAEIGRRVSAACKLDGGANYNGSTMIVKNGVWATFDPCNNPSDAWPIIVDKKICLAFDVFAEPKDGGSWVASPAYGWEKERIRHDNPLRAVMIVFLMMQDSANVPANSTWSDIR